MHACMNTLRDAAMTPGRSFATSAEQLSGKTVRVYHSNLTGSQKRALTAHDTLDVADSAGVVDVAPRRWPRDDEVVPVEVEYLSGNRPG